MKRLLIAICPTLFVLTSAVMPCFAEPSGASDEAAIRAASLAYLTALNQSDVDAIVNSWTPEGIFVDSSGESTLACELARQEFSAESRVNGLKTITAPNTSIRLVTPQVAIEQSATTAEGEELSFIAIWVKQNDRWLLNYLREIGSISPPQNPLKELSWIVGRWQTEGDVPKATLDVKWTDDEKFLLQDFRVKLPNLEEIRVQQRIAWDPSSRQIRSWLFRSDGGFEEGVWRREGDVWIVHRSGVLPDGTKSSTVNLWAPDSTSKCWFKTIEARIGDRKLQDVLLPFARVGAP